MTCHACKLVQDREEGQSPPWDSIYRGTCWDVVHARNCSLLGWIILVPHRHVESVGELTAEESLEFAFLMRAVSAFQVSKQQATKSYVLQLADNPNYPHVHFHIVPVYKQSKNEYKGTEILKHLNVNADQKVSESRMNKLADAAHTFIKEFS